MMPLPPPPPPPLFLAALRNLREEREDILADLDQEIAISRKLKKENEFLRRNLDDLEAEMVNRTWETVLAEVRGEREEGLDDDDDDDDDGGGGGHKGSQFVGGWWGVSSNLTLSLKPCHQVEENLRSCFTCEPNQGSSSGASTTTITTTTTGEWMVNAEILQHLLNDLQAVVTSFQPYVEEGSISGSTTSGNGPVRSKTPTLDGRKTPVMGPPASSNSGSNSSSSSSSSSNSNDSALKAQIAEAKQRVAELEEEVM